MNLHGSYPTSTSSRSTASATSDFEQFDLTEAHLDAPELTGIGGPPQPEPAPLPLPPGPVTASLECELLVAEATALLDLACRREPIEAARANRFARAVIEFMPLGPPALGVLDGGVLAAARLVELAGAVLALLATSCVPSRRRHGS